MEAAIIGILAPFLPHLLRAGESAAEEAAKALGSEAGQWAKALWARLSPKVDERPVARDAAERVAATPDDQRARGALELQLEEILQAEPRLAEELARIVRGAQESGAVNVEVRGDVHADRGSIGVIGKVGGSVQTGYPPRQP
jgi:hypothetical protein